ncbi:MAG: PIN domain-containing protein [Bifidobacteriaceae bacterium]|jgi:predicted nucleic acid-binding protein|nr:PIN domain-containing protein [Bifidobacteriaceae bacterium]
MTAPVFVDTNVLVYYFDQDEPTKRERAEQVMAAIDPVLSAQVLSEFYWTVTRKLARPVGADQAGLAVSRWARFRVIPITAALVAAAIQTGKEHQLAYWDALILEAAVAAGCEELLTEDLADGAVLRGVRIRNPFA